MDRSINPTSFQSLVLYLNDMRKKKKNLNLYLVIIHEFMNTLSWNSFLGATGGSGLSLVSSSLRSEMRFTGGARQ